MLENNNKMTDIFLWANNIDGIKRDLEVELFLFNKNYTPYSTRLANSLYPRIMPMFLYDAINFVNLGADTGLSIKNIEDYDGNKNQLLRADLSNVGRAETLIHLIENSREDIVEFNNGEHDMKRIKGVVAKFTHPTDKSIKFYIVKLIQQANVIQYDKGWNFNAGVFAPMEADVSMVMPTDNQVLIVDGDIFIYNRSKFEKLFNYDVVMIKTIEARGKIIDEKFRLSMPTIGQGFAFMVSNKTANINRLLKLDEIMFTQKQIAETVDDLGLQLMFDDSGAIILMDDTDVTTFLNILNDDYVEGTSGNHYLAKNKKPFEAGE